MTAVLLVAKVMTGGQEMHRIRSLTTGLMSTAQSHRRSFTAMDQLIEDASWRQGRTEGFTRGKGGVSQDEFSRMAL